MQAITVTDRAAGVGELSLTDMPYPHTAENDVVVRVFAAGFTPGELDWPATWSTAPAGTGPRACPVMNFRAWSPNWDTGLRA